MVWKTVKIFFLWDHTIYWIDEININKEVDCSKVYDWILIRDKILSKGKSRDNFTGIQLRLQDSSMYKILEFSNY